MVNKDKKTIAYDYLFNYFKGDTFDGKEIRGASITLAIKVYKDGKEIKFNHEPKYNDFYLCDVFQVSFDREKLYVVEKNLYVDNIFRLIFEWDKIEAEIVGYSLDYLSQGELEGLGNLSYTTPMEVSEVVFNDFLSKNINGFDISDNKKAQVPSVSFI